MKKTTMRILFALTAIVLLAVTGTGCTAKAKKAYHQSRADRFYDAGQLGQAEIEYLNTLRYDPASSQAFGRLGMIYYDQGRLQRALFFLAKGSEMAPENLDLRLRLGFIYSSVGQYSNALAQANFILAKKPLDPEAPLLLVEGSILPKDIEAARQKLQTLARTGDTAAIQVALGNLSMREHDVAAASAAYNKAKTLDAKAPAVLVALATVAWAQDDLKQAEALFKAAADSSPMRSPRRMQYVRFKVQMGDFAGAETALAEVLKEAPDYLPASMIEAEIAGAQKKYDECARWLDKVLELDPDDFDALYFQGQLDIARGDVDKGVTDMERMVRIYGQVPYVHYQLGLAYLAANDSTKAAGSFSRALELSPNYPDAILALAQIQIRNGNPSPAIVALERVRQKQPKLVQVQLLLADAYRMQNRVSDAISIYRSLETMNPTNAQVVLLHGAAQLQMKDRAAARKSFEHVLELVPDHLPAVEQLVDLDLAETNFAAATQLVNGQMQKAPNSVPLRILSAKIMLAQGKQDQAEKILLQSIEVDPASQSAYLLLAQVYSDSGQIDKARAKVDAAMARDPKNPSALMLAAKLYESNKDYKGAAEAYEKVLKIDAKYSPAMNNLAYLYSEYLNNLDRAYEMAQRARELLPFDPSTADTLGWVCFKRGSYPAALALLKESGAKLPEVPEIQFHLGMASYMTGDEPAAKAALQRAWQSGADFPGRAQCGLCISILNISPDTSDPAARATLEKRVAEKSDDPVALVRLARIYQREGANDKAISAYEGILQVTPKNLDALINLTRLYEPKDPKRAYDMAKAASKLAPYNPDVSHTLGRMAFEAGDYQLATSVLQQTIQTQPNDGPLQFNYARAAYSIGKVAPAQKALQDSLKLNLPAAQAAQARRMLDMMALAAAPDQAAAASARIAEILKAEPNDTPALMAQAAASEFKADAKSAEQTCERVLERFPDFIPAQLQLARLYSAEPAKIDRAYALASKVRDATPDDPAPAKILGAIMVQRGDYSHAINLLKQSALKLKSDPEVFYYLGSAQFHLKYKADSRANLQQAIALKLSGPAAESAKKMLSELK